MSLFTRDETRDLTYGDVWGTGSDPLISADTVTRIAPVYSAVSLIADLFVQGNARAVTERPDGELDPAPAPQWLTDPDPYVSPSTWRYQFVVSCKLRGNAYGLVDPGRRFVRWLHPDWVQVDESTPLQPKYFLLGEEQKLVRHGGSLLHIPEFVYPGRVKGISPIQQFMDLFDGAAAAARYGRTWFKNASIPPAILSTKNERVGADVLREARDDFVAAAKTGLPVALPGEWNWTRISVNPAEAQFLETIKANATTIASIFRVPAEDIGGEAGSSRTYSNREMDQELLNVRTMQPLGTRFGDGVAPLLPTGQKITVDFDGLAQPGVLESARTDSEQLKNGTLTLAEARRGRGRRQLTPEEIEKWQEWYATMRTESTSSSESVTKEKP